MKNIKIEIETKHLPLTSYIKQDVPNGVSIHIPEFEESRDITPATAIIIIEVAKDVAIGLFAAWLYSKIKGKATKITINRKTVELEEGVIRRVIEEAIQIKE